VESKFTEHWFYECSGHKRWTKGRTPNPDRSRCARFGEVVTAPGTMCHAQQGWGRRYWEYLLPVLTGRQPHLSRTVRQQKELTNCCASRPSRRHSPPAAMPRLCPQWRTMPRTRTCFGFAAWSVRLTCESYGRGSFGGVHPL
jgi:hypothetical protein